MRETLLNLYELQKIDTAAYELTQKAESIPRDIHELEQSLEGQRVELGTLNTELDQLKNEQREIEAKNAEEGEKHRKWKTRLNDIKSPREYQALSREVELGERQIRDSEERIMELMQQIEDRQNVIDEKGGVLREAEAEVDRKVRALRQEQATLKTQAEAASQGREDLVKGLNKRVLRRYDDLRTKRHGLAVVRTSKGACLGCNMAVRPQQLVEMLRFNSIEQCGVCHRIMVHEQLLEEEDRAL